MFAYVRLCSLNWEKMFKSLFGNYEGRCFRGKGRMAGATKEALRAATTEQLRKHSRAGRSQSAFSAKTLRAAGLLSVAGVGSFLTARCGDARNSPPWPQPKSLAAAPLVVSKPALRQFRGHSVKLLVCLKSERQPSCTL